MPNVALRKCIEEWADDNATWLLVSYPTIAPSFLPSLSHSAHSSSGTTTIDAEGILLCDGSGIGKLSISLSGAAAPADTIMSIA